MDFKWKKYKCCSYILGAVEMWGRKTYYCHIKKPQDEKLEFHDLETIHSEKEAEKAARRFIDRHFKNNGGDETEVAKEIKKKLNIYYGVLEKKK